MFIKSLYNWFLDSLFPRALEEDELFSFSPKQAWAKLPRSGLPRFGKPPIMNADSIFAYKDERVRKMVWNIKYKKSTKAVSMAGFALFVTLQNMPAAISGPIVLIPMPITARRLNERGYNQCHLLVDEIARLDIDHQFEIRKDLLSRIHHDSRQTMKNRKERLASTKGIFEANKDHAKEFGKRTIIVIDDVITTGSTMNEALSVMRNAGYENVSGLSLAH